MGNAMGIAAGALAALGLIGAAVMVVPPGESAPADAALAAERAPAPSEEASGTAVEAPRFDTVRVGPDGSGIVAGRAAPGSVVTVLAGGEVVAEAVADAEGRFVAFLDLPPSDEPREVALRAGPEGTGSEETVILGPLPVPEAVAEGAANGAEPPEEAADVQAGAAPVASAEPGDPAAAADAVEPEEAGQAPVLVSDAEGVRVIQPAVAPDASGEDLATVALDAITYGGGGEVRLAGRGAAGDAEAPGEAPAGGTVRVYLDNRLVAEAPVGEDGAWATALGDAAPGTYTLRVDQVGADGAVVSRIETPFRREERAALAQAMAEVQDAGQNEGQTVAVRTVQPGNTLWAIARDRYGEPTMYVRVFELNRDRIRDPDLIYPGQVFVLPAVDGL